MGFLAKGTPIGIQDDFLRDIRVGDVIADSTGQQFTINKYGRAKSLSGGQECSVKHLSGVTIIDREKPDVPKLEEKDGKVQPVTVSNDDSEQIHDVEEAYIEQIEKVIKDAGDEALVNELRSRGWEVKCSKLVEKIVYETVEL